VLSSSKGALAFINASEFVVVELVVFEGFSGYLFYGLGCINGYFSFGEKLGECVVECGVHYSWSESVSVRMGPFLGRGMRKAGLREMASTLVCLFPGRTTRLISNCCIFIIHRACIPEVAAEL
jgi:hypothetical protein